VVRVRDARRLTRVPSNLATFDLRAETMFWAVENPSPSISKCLDGGFVSYMFVSLLIDSLILGIRARADGENLRFSHSHAPMQRLAGRRRQWQHGAPRVWAPWGWLSARYVCTGARPHNQVVLAPTALADSRHIMPRQSRLGAHFIF
jgi:hypothetical protein